MLLKKLIMLLATTATLSSLACQQESDDNDDDFDQAYIRIPKSLIDHDWVMRNSFNADHKYDENFVFGWMDRTQLAGVSDYIFENIVELSREYELSDFDANTLLLADNAIQNDEDRYEGYTNYEQLTEKLEKFASDHSDIVSLETAGKSSGGRELWYVKISDNAIVDEAEPKLLYIANMHGDEVVGRELMLYLIRKLVNDYDSDDRIKKLVNNSQIYIMPSMNPDGFENGRRANGNGKDLNRNFPDFITNNNDTPAGRELETQHIMKLHAENHFLLALNFHGGEVCINLPWDTQANDTAAKRFGDDPLMFKLGREYADANNVMRANTRFDNGLTYGYEWYRVTGGMQDWASHYRRSIHATVELSLNKWPRSEELDDFWAQNEDSLISYLENGTRGTHVYVIDADGEPVLNPSIRVMSAPNRSVTYDGNIIHKPTLPGLQTVRISAAGFLTHQFDMEARTFEGQTSQIILTKEQ